MNSKSTYFIRVPKTSYDLYKTLLEDMEIENMLLSTDSNSLGVSYLCKLEIESTEAISIKLSIPDIKCFNFDK